MAKRYARLNWNSTSTYVSPENLNKMDKGINDCDDAIENLHSLVGTLSSLTTTEKSNLVGAINEVKSGVTAVNNNLESFESSKSSITCKLTSSYSFTTGSTRYYLPVAMYNSVGNNFSVNSVGNIVSNINGSVKISANIKFLSTVFPKYYATAIYKNTTFLTDNGIYSSGIITTCTITSFCTTVSIGDVIKLSAYLGAGAEGAVCSEPNSVYITIEDVTNNSDVEPQPITTKYTNKNISILGDSVSTFTGYIPNGNAFYYDGTKGDVSTMYDTWWGKVISKLGANLLVNNSWSASKVSGTSEPSANLTRCISLHDGTTNPDIIFVYMGINDFNNLSSIGTYNFNGDLPTTNTTFVEAYCVMLNKIVIQYPLAKIYLFTLPYSEMNGISFPERNTNGEMLKSYNDAIKLIAEMFCVEVMDISKCGINYKNLSTYCLDYNSTTGKGLHPNKQGMMAIAEYVLEHM